MKNKIKSFIETEKRLSKYKISILQKSDKRYAKRIVLKENDFISFDFSKISFSSIEECRDAVSLFKISKIDFMNKYGRDKLNSDIKTVLKKLKKYKIDVNNNSIDNFYFKSLSKTSLFKDDGTLKKVIKKRILNLKVLLLYSAHYIKKNKTLSIDEVVKNIYYYFYFNDWLEEYFDRFTEEETKLLYSIFCNYKNLFEDIKYKKLLLINKTKNTDLLITNLPHGGFEKVNLLYLELNKKDETKIIAKNNKFSNFPIDGKYYKCIKINFGEVKNIDDLDLENSFLICNLSRREMEHNLENILWLKFVLDKMINEENL